MVAVEQNIKSISQHFRAYSMPVKGSQEVGSLPELSKQLVVRIKDLKVSMKDKEVQAEIMIDLLEKSTWGKIDDAESLILVKSIITDARIYLDQEKQFLSEIKPIVNHGITRGEYSRYAGVIDDLEEAIYDINSSFFTLPNNEEFNDSINQLKLL